MTNIYIRRTNRISQHDYSQPGYYYVTICTENRNCILGVIEKGQMILNECGNAVKTYILELPIKYTDIELDQFIIMPNHVHVIINIVGTIHESSEINDSKNNIDFKRAIHELPLQIVRRNMLLSKMVGYVKMRSAKRINILRNCPGKSVWQRNYHDHIIRNDRSLQRIREYICNNTATWDSDNENLNKIGTMELNKIG